MLTVVEQTRRATIQEGETSFEGGEGKEKKNDDNQGQGVEYGFQTRHLAGLVLMLSLIDVCIGKLDKQQAVVKINQ